MMALVGPEESISAVPTNGTSSLSPCVAFYSREPPVVDIVSFHNTRSLRRSHEIVWRFGHTSEILNLLEGTSEDGGAYLKGIMSTSLAIFSAVLCWGVALGILRCLGYNRVGVLSGYRVKLAKPREGELSEDKPKSFVNANINNSERDLVMSSTDRSSVTPHGAKTVVINNTSSENPEAGGNEDCADDAARKMEEWQATVERSDVQLTRIRVAVLISGTIIVAMAICMVSKGVESLDSSVVHVQEGLLEAQGLALGGVELIDRFWTRQVLFQTSRKKLLASLNTFCPSVRPFVCENIETLEGCDYFGIPFSSEVQQVIESTRVELYLELSDMREDLIQLAEDFKSMHQMTGTYSWVFWMSAAYAQALAALTLIIMYGVIRAWNNKGGFIVSCFQNWFVMPLYALLVFLSWIFSMIFIILSTATADFCIDSPNDRVLAIVAKNRDHLDSAVYLYATWIIGGCPDTGRPSELADTLNLIFANFESVHHFSSRVASANYTEEFWNTTCGTEYPSYVIRLAKTLEGLTCVAANSLYDVEQFFSCNNWHPVYEETVYSAVCWESNEGFLWIATAQLVIVIFSMIMLTLRVAFQRDEAQKVRV